MNSCSFCCDIVENIKYVKDAEPLRALLQNFLSPQPLSDIGKAGKGLSGQLPYFVQPGAQVLNVGGIDAPGLVRPFRVLVQVGAAPLEQDDELAHIYQVQPHADTVQSHLADIGAHVQDAVNRQKGVPFFATRDGPICATCGIPLSISIPFIWVSRNCGQKLPEVWQSIGLSDLITLLRLRRHLSRMAMPLAKSLTDAV